MTFREEIQRKAQDARRDMVRTRELLTRSEFCARLAVTERRLTRMLATGSAFSMEVEGVEYFPAILAAPTVDRKRLQSVCRILVPAPPECRFDYLSSRHGNLGGITPLQALAEDRNYRRLREMAGAWAAEWSRTTVKIYTGSHVGEPADTEPTYLAVLKADPRTNLWKRAVDAMDAGGYIAPAGPYPRMDTATVFVVRDDTGHTDVLEARLEVNVVDGVARVRVHSRDARPETDEVPVARADDVVALVHQVVGRFALVKRR
ncbi:hypothetical protein [Paraburkholderia youngii]|uniref:hypothetical protein n=1 Tax=Paraburkholderia youngii TaxID=2782701 RepID=UPI003D249180